MRLGKMKVCRLQVHLLALAQGSGCSLLVAGCSLLIAGCRLFIAVHRLPLTAYCLLFTAYFLLLARSRCRLRVAGLERILSPSSSLTSWRLGVFARDMFWLRLSAFDSTGKTRESLTALPFQRTRRILHWVGVVLSVRRKNLHERSSR